MAKKETGSYTAPRGENIDVVMIDEKGEKYLTTRKTGTVGPFFLWKVNPDGTNTKLQKASNPNDFDEVVFGKKGK